MAKQFDIEQFCEEDREAVASWPDRWEILARGWTFPEDVEEWRQRGDNVLEAAAASLNLRAGRYRVIEWDDDYTLPTDKVHVFDVTTSTAYHVERVQRLRDDELVSEPVEHHGDELHQ
jgi:hypothetical protein